jgi:hypothetical protein
VVLGLVTTKFGQLETKDDLKRRIAEAAQYAPLDQLACQPAVRLQQHRARQQHRRGRPARQAGAGDRNRARSLGRVADQARRLAQELVVNDKVVALAGFGLTPLRWPPRRSPRRARRRWW